MRRLYGVGCTWVSVAALLSGCAQEAPAPGALTTTTAALGGIDEGLSLEAVSYTHLTLPTSYSV